MTTSKKTTKLLMTSVLALSLGACSVFYGQESGGQYGDDASITAKVKEALVAEPGIHAEQIHVETMNGVVQLSGFTSSAKGEARAVQLARRTAGVKSVDDNIVVSSPRN